MKTSTNWLGQFLELDIEKVAHGGIFVARHDSRVVFVSGAISGERVRVHIFEDRGGSFARGEVVEVITPSPDRVKHFWPEAEYTADGAGAGGAEFGHIKLDRQRELKADVLQEALERFAGIEKRVEVQSVGNDDLKNGLGYRTRVQLNVDASGEPGPFRERSHEVVPVRDLPLAVDEINELGLHRKKSPNVTKIEIASSSTGQLQWLINAKGFGDERLVERAGGRTFRLSPGAFWQVHRDGAETLAKEVVRMAKAAGFTNTAENLDLYGGVGLFSGALAAAFGLDLKITTVENGKQAGEDARRNLVDIKAAKSVTAPVERFLDERASQGTLPKGSTVVLDPPRAGAGKHVVSRLLELEADHIIYVACDPVAVARDLKPLIEGGYRIADITAFDLFPHTHHFETVVSLVR